MHRKSHAAVVSGLRDELSACFRALDASEKRYRSLVDVTTEGIVIMSDGHLLYANPAALRLLGATDANQLVGRKLVEFMHPDEWERPDNVVSFAVMNAGNGDPAPRERRCRRLDGSEILLELATIAVAHEGRPAMLAAFRDITQQRQVENALRQQAALLDLAPVAVIARDVNDRVTYWNPGAEALYGWPASEALGKITHDLLQTTFPESRSVIEQALLEHGTWEGEVRHRRGDGQELIVSSRRAMLRDSAGEPSAILWVNTDVTERSRMDVALQESETRLRAILDHTPSLMFTKDLDGRYVFSNQAFEHLLGPSPEQASGKTDNELFPESIAHAFCKNDGEVVRSRRASRPEEVDYEHNGRHTLLMVKYPLLDAQGTPYAVGGIATDVTEWKNLQVQHDLDRAASEHLAEARAIYEAAARNLTDGLMIFDQDHRVTFWNRRLEELLGVKAEVAVGLGLGELYAIVPPGVIEPDPARTAAPGQSVALLASQPDRSAWQVDSEPGLSLMVLTFPLLGPEGQFLGHARLVRDITHERAVERLKDQFVSMVSHELRTPMNGVIGMTELLLETPLDASQREFAETIHDSGQALVAIVNDILDISRLQSGKVELEETELDVRTLVEQSVELLSGPARHKGVELVGVVDRGVPHGLRGDPGRLRQVLTNLVGNAIKFTDQGEVALQIGSVLAGDGALILRGEVHDTGIGIEPSAIEHVFEPFKQADSSVTRRYGGTGLGLAISKQLVEAMGGEIGVTSEPGNGSTFWFTVCLKKPVSETAPRLSPDTAVRPTSATTRGPAATVSTPLAKDAPLVLVVDDVEVNLLVAQRMLRRLGYRSISAESGRMALETLARMPCAAILMDCRMPDMDGFTATAEIRRLEANVQHTPIIAMTAHANRSDREDCLNAGMDDYLSKPVGLAQLEIVMARWVR